MLIQTSYISGTHSHMWLVATIPISRVLTKSKKIENAAILFTSVYPVPVQCLACIFVRGRQEGGRNKNALFEKQRHCYSEGDKKHLLH